MKRKIIMLLSIIALTGLIALLPGIGYNATVEVEQKDVIGDPATHYGNTCNMQRLFSGYLKVSFNPVLYPISCLSGSGCVIREFAGASEVWDHEGSQVKEAATLGTLFVEFIKNVPFFLAFGVSTTLIMSRLVKAPVIARLLAKLQTRSTE